MCLIIQDPIRAIKETFIEISPHSLEEKAHNTRGFFQAGPFCFSLPI